MLTELNALRAEAVRRAGPRALHVLGVEQEADALAWRWGIDRLAARQAALVHDITKGLSWGEQLKLCQTYGIVTVSSFGGTAEKLVHALTGAAVARHEFGLSEEVAQAVRWHTTGRAGMALLEKVVYLADCVDSTRRHPGVFALRNLCYENLDAALRCALEDSIRHLQDKGRPICSDTIEAREYLLRAENRLSRDEGTAI
ncbi:MAG: bis(5'-nucleosyl)-tetraphosphatase (symmetrical) YqeK [Oscillospiraceae bacterium]|jgi:nicotinate-nucleotide adenylyltransferase|nr:bis(5'-nucleosyl)-tetraphosphatase (symmetrical) YqeK [Oscillospiraceae bacterium]